MSTPSVAHARDALASARANSQVLIPVAAPPRSPTTQDPTASGSFVGRPKSSCRAEDETPKREDDSTLCSTCHALHDPSPMAHTAPPSMAYEALRPRPAPTIEPVRPVSWGHSLAQARTMSRVSMSTRSADRAPHDVPVLDRATVSPGHSGQRAATLRCPQDTRAAAAPQSAAKPLCLEAEQVSAGSVQAVTGRQLIGQRVPLVRLPGSPPPVSPGHRIGRGGRGGVCGAP